MTMTSEPTRTTETTTPARDTAKTYARCGETPNASSGCNAPLRTEDEQRRGVCADFPMCS